MGAPTLSRDDFDQFFRQARGYPPFDWQRRLLDHVLSDGRWPHSIDAPTGSGKTAVVDVHVFANALAAVGAGPRVPRRLAVVVNRRMLVDHHDEYAGHLATLLSSSSDAESTAIARVAQALRSLVPPTEAASSPVPQPPVARAVLRGGLARDSAWRIQPEVCSVLTCTPDMWGSRLLLRGYGTSRRARPQEAGLLAYDSVVVVDEAHLSRQLIMTARRVSELVARTQLGAVPSLQVVDTTATPSGTAPADDVVGVRESDLVTDETLRRRLTRPKPVRLVPIAAWPATTPSSRQAMAEIVCREVDAIRTHAESTASGGSRTVGCVLNRVEDATVVAAVLRERGLTVALVTGRMRTEDRAALEAEYPGLLTIDGNDHIDVLVATQTIEVGIDVDLVGMVTDLAPGSALAQRAGRVNRIGRRELGEVVVLVPESDLDERLARSTPYGADDLRAARTWVEAFVDTAEGLSPWKLTHGGGQTPTAARRRDTWQRLSVSDVSALARTSASCHEEADLSLWLSDDLEPDASVTLVLRRLRATTVAPPVESVVTLLERTPPEPHELVSLRIGALRGVLDRYLAAGRQRHVVAPLYLVRAGDSDDQSMVVPLPVVTAPAGEQGEIAVRGLRPGDTVVADAHLALEAELATWAWGAFRSDAPLSRVDVFEGFGVASSSQGPGSHGRRLRIGHLSPLDGDAWLAAITAYRGSADSGVAAKSAEETVTEEQWHRAELAQALSAALASSSIEAALAQTVAEVIDMVTRDDTDAIKIVTSDEDESLQYMVLRWEADAVLTFDDLSTTSPRSAVRLPDHEQAVGLRARHSTETLGLKPELVAALELAGLHHDDGKSDERFQQDRLDPWGKLDPGPWAKSGPAPEGELRRRRTTAHLPRGWRHEQLSVVAAAHAITEVAPEDVDIDLVCRLVGTSHGVGRPSFPHASVDLLPTGSRDTLAEELFDEGRWEWLVESTDQRYGVWGAAYLEAILRAADVRVSKEGS